MLKRKLVDGKWLIKARLCVRGFKDRQVNKLLTFAGTASRMSQRLICALAAQEGWHMVSADVSAAFLKGITFADLTAKFGDIERDISFDLPEGGAAILRTLPGFFGFDPATEVLSMKKPGFGLGDAPRAWSLNLGEAIKAGRLKPSRIDAKLFLRHGKDGRLELVVSTHVDDLKMTGVRAVIEEFLVSIAEKFGGLAIHWNCFDHCGVRHEQQLSTMEVIISQDHYAKSLKEIDSAELNLLAEDAEVSEHLRGCYMSLLGGVAWLVITRVDVSV